jgi:hypothetical protein
MFISVGLPMKIDKTTARSVSGITLDGFEYFRDVDALHLMPDHPCR